jgi:peroxiredoxin
MRDWYAKGLTGIALAATSILVLFLSSRLRHLSADYRELRVRSTLPHVGIVVPTFRTATLRRDSVIVGEAHDSTVRQMLFVFNTSCPYCRSMIPVWRQLADSVGRLAPTLEVFAISLDPADSTRRYATEHALPYSVVTFPQPKLARLYRAVAVPQTIVLDWRGTVLYAKTGVLDRASLDSVYSVASNWSRR